LALTLLDWIEFGSDYARTMTANAESLSSALKARDVPVFRVDPAVAAPSHQFAVDASALGGGHEAALKLRKANLLACAIGLPTDATAGLRMGTPELARIGMKPSDMDALGQLVAAAFFGSDNDLTGIAQQVSMLRGQFESLHFIRA